MMWKDVNDTFVRRKPAGFNINSHACCEIANYFLIFNNKTCSRSDLF